MKKAHSRKLVVDASIARAAGGKDAVHPTAIQARDFLTAVLTICHKAVMTPPVRAEWSKHESRFATKWRSSMVARRKLVFVEVAEQEAIRHEITSAGVSEATKNAMLKDCHLLESAIATDYRVVSLDDTVRGLFKTVLKHTSAKQVIWVNPVSDPTTTLDWLKKGAPDLPAYRLLD